MHLRRALIFPIAIFFLSAWAVKPHVYRNDEFGINVPVPEGTTLCPTPDNEHDHGPVFVLGAAGTKDCADSARKRSIEVFAEYNAADATKKLTDFLKWQCAHIGGGPCGPPPSGLQVPGRTIQAGRVNTPDGWVDVMVVTQAGKPDPAFDPSVPSIKYTLGLHTETRYLDQDLRTFRTILGTIRLSPGAPNR